MKMSIELTSFNGAQFHLSDLGWEAVIRLAGAHGFAPDLDRGAGLSSEEAAAFAAAVERGLQAMLAAPRPAVSVEESVEMTEDELLPYWFGPKRAAHWRSLIAFCRRGGFRIQ